MSEAYDWRLGFGEYLVAILALAVIVAAAYIVGRALRMRLLPGRQGPPAWLATGVLAISTAVLAAELLGLFGLLTRGLYVALLVALAVVTALTGRIGGKAAGEGGEPSDGALAGRLDHEGGSGSARTATDHPAWLVAAAVVAIVVLGRAAVATIETYGAGMTGFDTHWYHGPFTALFLQSGDTFALYNEIAPQYLSWFYPQNSELLHAIAALPFDRDLLSPGLNLIWLAGSMLAAWCIGRPFGVAPLSLIAASLILGSGLLFDQAGEMRNDIPAVFFVLAAAAIAVGAWSPPNERGRHLVPQRHQMSPTGWGALVVVGLAAGLAAGTKLNYLATAGALIVALAFALPKGRRGRGFGVLFGAAFLTGGYWYVRNLVHSGNPLPWITSAGPLELPGPTQEIGGREGHGVLEYLLDAAVWRDWFLPGLREALTLAWPLLLVAAAATTVLLLLGHPASARRDSRRRRPSVHVDHRGGVKREPMAEDRAPRMPLTATLGLTILATVAAWLVAPASAEGPAGEPVGFVSGLRYLAPALALALALFPVVICPLLAAIGLLRAESDRSDSDAAGGPSAARAGAVGPSSRRASPRQRWALPVLACGLGVVALAAGFFLQRFYLEHRYAEPDFSTPGLNKAFAAASKAPPKPDGAAPVAVTSTRIYAFFGPDLRQPVAYVGIAEPNGGFRRPQGCAEWRQAVNRTGAEILLVAWDRLTADQDPLPPEAAWIGSDPAAKRVSAGGGAARFRLEGKLDPAACP